MHEPELITDRADPAVQRIIDVAKPSRAGAKTVLVEDAEPLTQAIAAGVELVEVYVLEGATAPDAVLAACEERGIAVRTLALALAGAAFKSEKKPKLFGIAKAPKAAKLSALDGHADGHRTAGERTQGEQLRAAKTGDIIVLDGVRIVGNIGAIVRTAFALGASGVVLIDSELASITDRRLVRASRGYVFSLPVVLATREQALAWLRERSIRVFSLDIDGTSSLDDLRAVDERIALVFGSEKRGASSAFERGFESVVIPMRGAAESLNVSVSAGIALGARSSHNLG